MKKSVLVVLAVVAFVAAGSAEPNQLIVRVQARSWEELRQHLDFKGTSITIAGADMGRSYDLMLEEPDLALVRASGLATEIVVPDLDRAAEQAMLDGYYQSYDSLVRVMRWFCAIYSSICRLESIGTTHEGRWAYGVKVSDNPNVDEDEPEVLLVGLHHAREWATPQVCRHILDTLVSNYSSNTTFRNYVDNHETWIFPVINPDGYVYDYPAGRYWRKNRQPFASSIGCDPNRNYNGCCNGNRMADWGSLVPGSATSHLPSSAVFFGASGNWGREINALTEFFKNRTFVCVISYHSYSELVLWPYGHGERTRDSIYYRTLGQGMAAQIQRLGGGYYTPQQSNMLYPTNGGSDDWMYGWAHYIGGFPCMSYTLEVGTAFYQNTSQLDHIQTQNFRGAWHLMVRSDSVIAALEGSVPRPILARVDTVGPAFTLRWTPIRPEHNHPDRWELEELTGLSVVLDSFESGFSRWDTMGALLSSTQRRSGNYSFQLRNGNNVSNYIVTKDPYPVQAGDSLRFWVWYNTENNYDVVVAEVSIEGREWHQLHDRLTGNSNGWVRRAYSLAPWVGRSVFIRFRYMTDDNTVGTGVYIDDVWPVPAFSGRTTISSNITDTLYSFTGKAAGTYYYRVRGRNVAWGWNDFGPLEDVVVVRRDVGVTALLAPSGTVDSGNVVVPACSVYNYGTLTEAYAVSMRIGTDYAEATMVIGHAPGTTRYVTFPGWTAGRRGTYAVTCSTRLGGDADSSNDARAGAVTVQVRDVACRRLLAPAGTVDSGITVTPACSVANPGSTTESYQVRMKVGTFYNLTTTVANHAPGTTVYITFPNWVATQLGTHAVSCSTELSDDLVQANNRQSGLVTVERPPLHDVGATVVIAPTGTNDSGTSVVPACTVYNYGNMPESYLVRMKVGTTYNETASVTGHAPGARLYVTFPSWNASARGTHVVTCSTELATDTRPDNDRASGQVEVRVADVDLSTILFPVDSVPLGTVVAPRVRLRNNGTGPAVFPVRLVITGTTVVFDTTEADVALNPGETRDYLFAGSWTAGPAGDYTTLAWTALGGDLVPANDSARNAFAVSAAGAGGWVEKRSMPLLTSGKQAKDGAWLAFAPSGRGLTLHASRLTPDRGPALDPSTPRSPDPSLSGVVYAAKGNKSSDFYRYDVERDTWTTLASIPDGRENKKPGKGAVGAAGGGFVYAVKGNNTQGFWRYAPSQDSWQQMADVPLGLSNKKVKGGTDLVYVGDLGQYPERLYLLKGGRNEFWRYDISRDSWRETSEAPIGLSGRIKYDKGSWLAYAPAGAVPSEFGIVYCHKAKYHELYAFQPVTETWLPQQLDGMPFVGRSGKKKKSKDGGSAAILDGYVYALKGGNTDEFWQYAPEQDSWTELEPMPLLGSTGKAKKVKAGADATATHDFLFALKGNKTLEFWRYAPGTTLDASRATPDAREGGQSGMKSDASGVVRISPNPLRAGFVTLRWDMTGVGHDRIAFGQFGSRPEHAGVSLFDATGRCVRRRALSLGHEASGIVLDLRALPAGVYLLRLTAGGYSTTQKLVIQR